MIPIYIPLPFDLSLLLTFQLQGCFGLYGILLVLYYVTHLETDPLSHRTRFIIFNKEQEKQLGKMILQYVSKHIAKGQLKKNRETCYVNAIFSCSAFGNTQSKFSANNSCSLPEAIARN